MFKPYNSSKKFTLIFFINFLPFSFSLLNFFPTIFSAHNWIVGNLSQLFTCSTCEHWKDQDITEWLTPLRKHLKTPHIETLVVCFCQVYLLLIFQFIKWNLVLTLFKGFIVIICRHPFNMCVISPSSPVAFRYLRSHNQCLKFKTGDNDDLNCEIQNGKQWK